METLIVVDDFYTQPERVREFALKSEYIDLSSKNYPGFESSHEFVSVKLVEALSKLVKAPISFDQTVGSFGKFRFINAHTTSRLKVHTDRIEWAGLVYLTPGEHSSAGTSFYRHKRTLLEGPPTPEQYRTLAYKNFEDYEKDVILRDTLNHEAWEVSSYVSYKFNRLVLFKGSELFHSHSHGFGETASDSRLTQNFFFNLERNEC